MDGLRELDPQAVGTALGVIVAGIYAIRRVLRWDNGWRELHDAAKEEIKRLEKQARQVEKRANDKVAEFEVDADRLREKIRELQETVDKTYEYIRRIRELEEQVRTLEADLEAQEIENDHLVNELVDVKGALAAQLKVFPSPLLDVSRMEGEDDVQEAH
jgi:predicted RNase H-like nuclease (RuvC/YqgF family)